MEENEALKTRLAEKEARERQLVVSREGAAAEREDKEEEGRALEVRGEAEEATFRELGLVEPFDSEASDWRVAIEKVGNLRSTN